MELYKYVSMGGTVSLNVNGRKLVLNRDPKVVSPVDAEILDKVCKVNKNIRKLKTNEVEVANYIRTNPVRSDIKDFSDSQIIKEFARRFPKVDLSGIHSKTEPDVEQDFFSPVSGGGFTDSSDLEPVLDDVSVPMVESINPNLEAKSEGLESVENIPSIGFESESESAVIEPILEPESVEVEKVSTKPKTKSKTQL